MAVITQADPYSGLIKKMGYSVGLEELIERVKKLVSIYVKERGVSAGSFVALVEKDFGRENAVEHFANFYGTLNLVRFVGESRRNLEPLYQLDSLSILRRLYVDDDAKYDLAARVVLTQCILEVDGDIFVNGLQGDFQPDVVKGLLESMVHAKRQRLSEVIRTPGLINKIYQVVDIKNESTPESRAGKGSIPQGRYGKRTEPLDLSRRTTKLDAQTERSVSVPADYLSKVRTSRGGWAQDLGFFDRKEKTDRGKRLLEGLEACITWSDSSPPAALFWGYTSELAKLRLKPSELKARECEAWDLLSGIACAFNDESRLLPALGAKELVDFLERAFRLYRAGNDSKGLIRNSLPMYVAEPVLVGWSVAERCELPNLGKILEEEFRKKVRRVQKMIIRGTAGALFFMK